MNETENVHQRGQLAVRPLQGSRQRLCTFIANAAPKQTVHRRFLVSFTFGSILRHLWRSAAPKKLTLGPHHISPVRYHPTVSYQAFCRKEQSCFDTAADKKIAPSRECVWRACSEWQANNFLHLSVHWAMFVRKPE